LKEKDTVKEIELKPGWLMRDIAAASERIKQWEAEIAARKTN